jgi:hypothetical protein
MAAIRIPLFQKYQVVASTDPVFGVFGPDQVGTKRALTSGSSTTVTSVTAGDAAFGGLQAGAELSVNRDGTRDVVYITTWTDEDNIVVDTAVNWEAGPQGSVGRQHHFRRFLSGQGVNDGWFNAEEFDNVTIQYELSTFNATSVTLYTEGRIKGSQMAPVTLVDNIVLTATGEGFITIPESVDEVRFGALVTGDSGSNLLSAYALCRPRARA